MTELYHFPTSKFCTGCKTEKPLDEYRKWDRGVLGVRPRCAECERAYERARNQPSTRARRYSSRKPLAEIFTREGYKVCPICKQELLFENFTLRKDRPGGRPNGACKECERARDRERNALRRPRRSPLIPQATKEGHKVCNTCLDERPYAAFHRDSAQMDGHRGRCKQCYKDQWDALSEEEKGRLRKQDTDSRVPRLEQRRAYDRERHNTDEHRAKRRDRAAIRKMEDPEYRRSISEAAAQWRKSNPLTVRETNQRHKPGQRAARSGVRISYKRILERDGHFCYICNHDILPDQEMDFDHEIPLHPRHGEPQGIHDEGNIHPTHSVCNMRKSNKRLEALTAWDRRGPDN
jgi:hypothetical protein